MTLQEGISINDKFQNSINLSLDLNHMDKVDAYIPTRSSLEVLEGYIDNVLGKKKEYATILIGPYGKGKSHLLLVLLTLLRASKECNKAAEQLLKRIEKGKPYLAEKIQTIQKEKKRFLPVLLVHVQEDLNRGFLLALHEALLREGLKQLIPTTYFSEAIAVIEGWKKDYPNTYQSFSRFLIEEGTNAEKMIRQLSQYDKKSYEQFVRIYPKLTSGGIFQPMINMSALAVYQSVNEVLCKEYGYTGMFLIFDEFSKYMENHQPETISGDMKILQEMCELANSSDERQIHLTFVAHKSIKEYGTFLPTAVLNSFTGVEGRMTEVFFLTSMKNNYELISYAIKKKEGLYADYWKDRKKEEAFIEAYYSTAGFSSVFIKEEFQKIVVEGCFPLTPLAAYFLLSVSEKVAQNERTLFTFLSKDEPYSLFWTVRNREKEEEWLIGMSEIYDYFSSIFRKDASLVWIHREWLKADFALSQTKDSAERKLIKTLALVRMLNMPEEISASDKILCLGSSLLPKDYQAAKERLIQKQLLYFRVKTAAYDFKQKIGVDLEEEIRRTEQLYFTEVQTVKVLQKYAGMDYEIPKQYNQDYAMTRFFQYQFIDITDFFKLTKAAYLFEDSFADGKILLLTVKENWNEENWNRKINSQKELQERIKGKLEELNDSRISLIYPQLEWKEDRMLCRISAIEYLLKNEEFLEQNQVIREELLLTQEDTLYELNQILQEMYRLEQGKCILYVRQNQEAEGYKSYIKLTQIQYNRILSRVLEGYYNETPVINQELVNRNHISAPIRKARNHIVEKLLKQEDCQIFESGTSPEATIFRAALWHTGLLGEQQKPSEALLQVVEQIERFIHGAEKRKCCFLELYQVLQGKNIGMRRGVIPIYLAYCFVRFQGMIVIYLKEKEIALSMETLDQINEDPSKYFLCTEKGTLEKSEYQKKLIELFQDFISGTYGEKDQNQRIAEGISRWMRSLSQYTLLFTEPIDGMEEGEFQKLYEFRRLFQQQEINPWEVLFLKIPKICGMEERSYLKVSEQIACWKRILDGHLSQRKKQAADGIKAIFHCKDADLAQGLKLWYQEQNTRIEQRLYDTATNHFLNYIQKISTHDEEEIVSRISKILLDLFVEDWNDGSLSCLLEILQQTKQKVELSQKEERIKETDCRVLLEDESGAVVEKYYRVKEGDTNVYLFRNTLMDLLEEVGESVELEQKVAVLSEALRELILSNML